MLTRCLASISLLVVALAGCASAAPHGATLAPVSVAPLTATPTPAPAPTPSATPFLSTADEAGAKAFVTAYFAEWDRALATGDTSRMESFRLATCVCVRAETRIKATYAAGGTITGAKLTVLKWAYGAHGPAFARTAIAFHATATTYKIPGSPDLTDPALYGDYFVDLRRSGTHWIVSDVRYKELSAP
jgi:Family of unknown function (DUF6318)